MDITTLIPAFGSFAVTIIAFVVALSVIVAIHEYGHYIVGRWCGIKADVFSLGFGPVLWAREDRRGTVWQIAALPFGGYVKFRGDANAASGKDGEALEALSQADLRQTMHGAPLWARAATVAAGPVFNFVLSILVFAGVIMFEGRAADPLTVASIPELPEAVQQLELGDQILAIGGLELPPQDQAGGLDALIDDLPLKNPIEYTVRRDGAERVVLGPYPMPARARQISPQSAAYDIDMRAGDVITHVAGDPVVAFSQLKEVVEASEGRPIALNVWRDGETLDFTLVPRRVDEPLPEGGFQTQWRIGIAGGLVIEPATEALNPIQALGEGVTQTRRIIDSSLSGLVAMIKGQISSCNMSGPVGIAQISGAMASQGSQSFIWFIAVLSTAVGLLNLFPVPVLDGGHLVFFAYEAVVGRPPSENALRLLMSLGLAIVLGVMLFALSADLFCP